MLPLQAIILYSFCHKWAWMIYGKRFKGETSRKINLSLAPKFADSAQQNEWMQWTIPDLLGSHISDYSLLCEYLSTTPAPSPIPSTFSPFPIIFSSTKYSILPEKNNDKHMVFHSVTFQGCCSLKPLIDGYLL